MWDVDKMHLNVVKSTEHSMKIVASGLRGLPEPAKPECLRVLLCFLLSTYCARHANKS